MEVSGFVPSDSGQRPLISVCILTRYRPAQLGACLASLQRQKRAPSWELLVFADRDRRVSPIVATRFPGATIGIVQGALPGEARNFLIENARGDLLLFLDDDVVVRPNLLRKLAVLAEAHPDAAVFGGPNETPNGSTTFQVVQGAVLASFVASGPVRKRYGAHPAGRADERSFTLCNLAVRREAMLPFSSQLVCAEENAVLSALKRRGDRMHYDPGLVVFHERRPDLRTFAQQMFKYGRGRGQLVVRQPTTFRPVYLVPPLLVLYSLVALALLPWRPLFAAGLAAYGVAVAAEAGRIAMSVRRRGVLATAGILIVVVHFCYGTGILRGLFSRPRRSEPTWVRVEAEPARMPWRDGKESAAPAAGTPSPPRPLGDLARPPRY
jgi:hypothetical protein